MEPYGAAIKKGTATKEQRIKDVLESLEVLRTENKNLWNELAQTLGIEFKHERMHNDNIIRILKRATQHPRGTQFLTMIARNDRRISEHIDTLAEMG